MKINPILYTLPVLFLSSCFKGDNATETDSANDAAGTGSPYLAREVAGVWQLSTDQRFGYDEPCNVLNEGLIQSTFDMKATDELKTLDYPNGCEFKWSGGTEGIMGVHVWKFTAVNGGVLIQTEESWEGERVLADTAYAKQILDQSVKAWLESIRKEAEARVR